MNTLPTGRPVAVTPIAGTEPRKGEIAILETVKGDCIRRFYDRWSCCHDCTVFFPGSQNALSDGWSGKVEVEGGNGCAIFEQCKRESEVFWTPYPGRWSLYEGYARSALCVFRHNSTLLGADCFYWSVRCLRFYTFHINGLFKCIK